MIGRIQDWMEYRKARQRYKLHLEVEDAIPGQPHHYPMMERDEETIRRHLKRKSRRRRGEGRS
jgi:hypothetical protein